MIKKPHTCHDRPNAFQKAFQHWITDPVWNAAVGWVVSKAGDGLLSRAKAKLTDWTADT